jgi:alcohol dehydrogenase
VLEDLPINAFWLMTNRITLLGSVWFSTKEGEEMVQMAQTGVLDLSCFEHRISPLSEVNSQLGGTFDRTGGFTNYVVAPQN